MKDSKETKVQHSKERDFATLDMFGLSDAELQEILTPEQYSDFKAWKKNSK